MGNFTDNFERPDGPINNGWIGDTTNVIIDDGKVYSSDSVTHSIVRDLGDLRISHDAVLIIAAGWRDTWENKHYQKLFYDNIGNWYEYQIQLATGINGALARIYRVTPWWVYTLIDSKEFTLSLGEVIIRCRAEHNLQKMWVNDDLMCQGADSQFESAQYCSIDSGRDINYKLESYSITYDSPENAGKGLFRAPLWGRIH